MQVGWGSAFIGAAGGGRVPNLTISTPVWYPSETNARLGRARLKHLADVTLYIGQRLGTGA